MQTQPPFPPVRQLSTLIAFAATRPPNLPIDIFLFPVLQIPQSVNPNSRRSLIATVVVLTVITKRLLHGSGRFPESDPSGGDWPAPRVLRIRCCGSTPTGTHARMAGRAANLEFVGYFFGGRRVWGSTSRTGEPKLGGMRYVHDEPPFAALPWMLNSHRDRRIAAL